MRYEKIPSALREGAEFQKFYQSPRQALRLRLSAPAVFGNILGDYITHLYICQSFFTKALPVLSSDAPLAKALNSVGAYSPTELS